MVRRDLTIDCEIVQGFIACTLPKVEWTHHAHLRVGLWHVLSYPQSRALELMRDRIRAYNEATGVENSDHSGYHETITRFYLNLIGSFVRSADDCKPFGQLTQELIAQCGERDLLLRYYSRERLSSVEARRAWLEPDLKPQPLEWSQSAGE